MKDEDIPKELGSKGVEFWRNVLAEFDLTDFHDLTRLKQAAQCLDELDAAENQIKADGMYLPNRYGNVTEHPACKTVRDLRLLHCKIIRELSLDLPSPESRPPRTY